MRLSSLRLVFTALMAALIVVLSACEPVSSPALTTPTAPPVINRDKAIEIAIGGCKIPHLVLVGEPKNIQAKLLTLDEAYKLTREEGSTTNFGIPMDTSVWMVQMDGQLQLMGGPAPVASPDGRFNTPTPSQPFWGTCIAVLDANSGKIIFIRG
jgi:hypothetical protein